MDANRVTELVRSAFGDDDVIVEGAGANYNITVVSERFAGLRAVARQQAVYAALNAAIAAGDIHAVNLHTFTPEEWRSAQG